MLKKSAGLLISVATVLLIVLAPVSIRYPHALLREGGPALSIALRAAPATFYLIIASSISSFAVAILMYYGLRRASVRYTIALCSILSSIQMYGFLLFLQLLFTVRWHAFPPAGMWASDHFDLGDRLHHLFLPCAVITAFQLPALIACADRAEPKLALVLKRMALTLLRRLPALLSILYFVEVLFGWPGIFRLLLNALGQSLIGVFAVISLLVSLPGVIARLGVLRPRWSSALPARSAAVLLAVILAVTITGVLSQLVQHGALYIDSINWQGTPIPPCFVDAKHCGGHVLGTDEVGRDLLARLMLGAALSLILSLVVLCLSAVFALAVRAILRRAARSRQVLVWVADAIAGLPPLPMAFLAICFVTAGSDFRHDLSFIPITVLGFIVAAKAISEAQNDDARLLFSAIVRRWPSMILTLGAVDFFGFGLQPPYPSLGNMLSNIIINLQVAWWAAVFPSLYLFLLALVVTFATQRWRVQIQET